MASPPITVPPQGTEEAPVAPTQGASSFWLRPSSALAAGLGFFSQLCFHDLHRPAIGKAFRFSAIGVAIAGYVLFLAGLYEAGSAFIAAVA